MKRIQVLFFIIFCLLLSCRYKQKERGTTINEIVKPKQYITVLGTAQDAGFPQIDCEKPCCKSFYNGKESKKWCPAWDW